jgi:hypothetical protein
MSQSTLELRREDSGRDAAVQHVCYYHDGLITQDELHKLLDDRKIRGAYSPQSNFANGTKPAEFIGYDYNAQRWLHITL